MYILYFVSENKGRDKKHIQPLNLQQQSIPLYS